MRVHILAVAAVTIVTIGASPTTSAETIFGVTNNAALVSFDSTAPNAILSSSFVSGLQSNEQLLGIDFRPATGQLYGIGSFSNLYTLNTSTGAATLVGAGNFMPPINGSAFGFDFNPVIDRIRLDSDANKNFVLNPNDGTATEVTDLFYGPGDDNEGTDPNVIHAAYTNSFDGATTTQLYGIDSGLDILVTQANSAGTLGTVGSIGTDVTNTGGFDISGDTGVAFAVVEDTSISRSTFWTIDLMTGVGTQIGEVGGGNILTALAVAPAPVPEPASVVLALLGAVGLAAVCRRK